MPRADGAGEVVTPRLLRAWSPSEPDDGGDKHSRGTVAIVGGATSTPGAVLLAGLAALRAGTGRLQVLTVDTTSVAVAVALPEAMVQGLPADATSSLSPAAATGSSTPSPAPGRWCSDRVSPIRTASGRCSRPCCGPRAGRHRRSGRSRAHRRRRSSSLPWRRARSSPPTAASFLHR